MYLGYYPYVSKELKIRQNMKKPKSALCRWFRFAQLAKGKKSRP